MAYGIEDIITWAKISQVLARKEAVEKKAISDAMVDDRLSVVLYMERTSLAWKFSKSPSDASLFNVGNYVYALCGKHLNRAKYLANIGGGGAVVGSIIPGVVIPQGVWFTGDDLDVDDKYINPAFAGYSTITQYRGLGFLQPVTEVVNLSEGGCQILLSHDEPFTIDDLFYISVNFGG